jgi:hypothetical protein
VTRADLQLEIERAFEEAEKNGEELEIVTESGGEDEGLEDSEDVEDEEL